jgi:hypothetical protein
VNDAERRQAIQDSLNAGRLPRTPAPLKVFASRGNGGICAGCGRAIEVTGIEYEFTVDARVLRMHLRCFELWRDEVG